MDPNNITIKDIEVFSKPQALRLWDVFFLGPFLIYLGYTSKSMHGLARGGLVTTGALTILYNGRNYLLNEKAKREL